MHSNVHVQPSHVMLVMHMRYVSYVMPHRLQHPLGSRAPASTAPGQDAAADATGFGMIPHQMRGFLTRWTNTIVTGAAFERCTACSHVILDAYRTRGHTFVMDVLNSTTAYLEDMTGLTAMKRETERMMAEMEAMEDEEGDAFEMGEEMGSETDD